MAVKNRTLVVVDDFYPDPEAVRRKALALEYEPSSSNYGYNGLRATIDARWRKKLLADVCALVDAPDAEDVGRSGELKSLSRKQFRQKRSVVHYDLADWSGVLILSPPTAHLGCTTFWRHKGLGLDGFHDLAATSLVCRKRKCTLADLATLVDEHSARPRHWEETSRVEHRFNRLILFRGNMFHAASEGFGTNVANSKLTQTFFFDTREP